MSIFTNIAFIHEGEQAEEYKARKAKEAEDKRKAEEERNKRRYSGLEKDNHSKFVGNQRYKTGDLDKYSDSMSKDERRANQAAHVANRNTGNNSNFNRDFDSANRDMRRHPEKWKTDDFRLKRESTIFESVQFLNE